MNGIDVHLMEEDRQSALLALAALSVERPGWDDHLQHIAKKLGGADLYASFKNLRGAAALPAGHREEVEGAELSAAFDALLNKAMACRSPVVEKMAYADAENTIPVGQVVCFYGRDGQRVRRTLMAMLKLQKIARSKPMEDMTEPELQELMQALGAQTEMSMPDGPSPRGRGLFVLLAFGDPKVANYVSNARREDIIKSMRECADRLEAHHDISNEPGSTA